MQKESDTLAEAFLTFAQWNLATGDRAGEMTTYDYAQYLNGLVIEGYGDAIERASRPLSGNWI